MNIVKSSKAERARGCINIPGDKSISHRALIIGSQCVGPTRISGLLESEDVLHTADALKHMGVNIYQDSDEWVVDGVGVGGLIAPEKPLYLGNSGTSARLLMGLVASYPFETEFTGDASLTGRPMKRVISPLLEMGAEIKSEDNKLPISVSGKRGLAPMTYEVPVASAQVKSAIILAALNVEGNTTVIEKAATRNHTELMLKYLGADIKVEDNSITLVGHPELSARDIVVPADPSSAAFFIVMALIVPGAEITVKNVLLNPLRIGLYKTLEEMGAKIEYINNRVEAGENIADIKATYSQLNAIDVPEHRAPSMIDEYPILSIAAAFATGTTRMNGLEELRVKESDRLAAIVDGLQSNGVPIKAGEDWLEVTGSSAVKGGGIVKTHMDHRIAMSFLILGTAANNPVTIDDASMIATSFPSFLESFTEVGGIVN